MSDTSRILTGPSGLTVELDPFEAQSDAAVFNFDALYIGDLCGTSPTITVTVEHRNSDETAYSTAGSPQSVTSPGAFKVDVSALKQQVRYKIEFGDTCGIEINSTGYDFPNIFVLRLDDVVWYQSHP